MKHMLNVIITDLDFGFSFLKKRTVTLLQSRPIMSKRLLLPPKTQQRRRLRRQRQRLQWQPHLIR